MESDGVNLYQVWRFLVNGDLRPTQFAGPTPCPVPPCAPATNRLVRFTGYIDYAYDLGNQSWQTAWRLTHACDAIDHVPGLPRGGVFHPDRTYTFVGPSTGFVPGGIQPVESGPIVAEAVRRGEVMAPQPAQCTFEERAAGNIAPVQFGCLCGSGPPQWSESVLTGAGARGTQFAPIPGTEPFLTMGVGEWTLPGVYPGPEKLRWTAGRLDYLDACTNQMTDERFFGVTTFAGWLPLELTQAGIGGPLPDTFIDQSNSVDYPTLTTLWNVPYVSTRVLNLNL